MNSLGKETAADHLIIGAGIAGLMLALKLARLGKRVLVIAKSGLNDNNTWYAQGGIASVFGADDSFEQHVGDTLKAGAGLCHPEIVRLVVEEGPDAIQDLITTGVDFTREQADSLHLTREGGHSQRRVIHANDTTGRAILAALIAKSQANENIDIYENLIAIDLLTTDKIKPSFSENTCLGAYALHRPSGTIIQVRAQATYLCTGGHGKVYLYTSNPDCATGDGLAMAWRAGCRVANLEFMQFHPTCLYHTEAKNFLISEAVRGEGAELVDRRGNAFMAKYHTECSLAPRDVVARAIDMELKEHGDTFVYLDATKIGAGKLVTAFPNIYETCQRFGIDITKDMIPVVPAAHYSCGGIAVDAWGRTNIRDLFALGEVACTGVHGANRLASNSLLEAVVFARRVAAYAEKSPAGGKEDIFVPPWDDKENVSPDELVVLTHTWDEIRRLMWNYVGIVRTKKRLERALERVSVIRRELNTYYWNHHLSAAFIEVRNLADVAYLTIQCAMRRKESRGIHYTLDYPQTLPLARDTILANL